MAKHRKLIALALGSAMTVSMAGLHPASAQTISGMQDQVHKQQKQLDHIGGKKAQAIRKVNQLQNEISNSENKINDTQTDLEKTTDKVSKLQNGIMQTQKRIDRRNNLLKKRIRTMYDNGSSVHYLQVLLSSQSFSDFIDRAFALNLVAKQDRHLLNKQKADKKQLESDKKDINHTLDNLQDQLDSLKELKGKLGEKKQKQNALVKHLDKQGIDIKKDIEAKQHSLEVAQEKAAQEKASQEKEAQKGTQQEQTDQESSHHTQQGHTSSNSSTNHKSPASSSSHATHHSKPAATQVSHGSGVSGIIAASRKYFGNSHYVWGGGRTQSQIQKGQFDCSGFVHWAYQQIGVNVGWSTGALSHTGTRVSYSNIQPGDMVFFNTNGHDGHVGIYIGNGLFIGSQSSTGVAIANMNSSYWKSHFSGHVQRVL